jgi:N-dimethylarginine dimethylaminohydrolase
MTSPTSFDVKYEINPWMDGKIGTVDHVLAAKQWSELRNALVSKGVDVIVLPKPPDHCPDAVFTASAGLIYENKFIPSSFKHPERQVEEAYFIDWFNNHLYDVDLADHPSIFMEEEQSLQRCLNAFEGMGDALFNRAGNILWFGFGFRSNLTRKVALDDFFETTDIIVRPLELIDPRWYHLDTCFCPLETGELLWYPPAFSEHSRYTIETWYGSNAIAVSEADALALACNAISIGNHLIVPEISDELDGHLMGRGYLVEQLDMSEFLKSGGACKSLILQTPQ